MAYNSICALHLCVEHIWPSAYCAQRRELVMLREVICSARLLQWINDDMRAERAALAAARASSPAIFAGNDAWRQALPSRDARSAFSKAPRRVPSNSGNVGLMREGEQARRECESFAMPMHDRHKMRAQSGRGVVDYVDFRLRNSNGI